MTSTRGDRQRPVDLPAAAFKALAESLFDEEGNPVPFTLRGKGETQDDPFDEHIADILEKTLPSELRVLRAGKPLVSPDIVLARPEEYQLLARGERISIQGRLSRLKSRKLRRTRRPDGQHARPAWTTTALLHVKL